MAEIATPYIQSDGTHVIPVQRIHRLGQPPNENSRGDVCWSRRDGLSFQFQTTLTSFFDFSDIPTELSVCGAGSVHAIKMDPEWYAETADGSPVRLYATSDHATTSMTTSWSIEKGNGTVSSKRVHGTACYAEVGLSRDSSLAYWHETLPGLRLYSPGWEIGNWGVQEKYDYTINDTTYTQSRRSFSLGASDGRALVSSQNRENGLKGVWLTYQHDEQENPFWFPDSCDRLRGLMSILLGQHVVFVWRDTPTTDGGLNRLYYGWHKGVDSEHPLSQLVPFVGTVEALSHGGAVSDRLPVLDRQFAELRKLFDPEWVASPLWTAAGDFLDNRLAHACVALERLSSAYHDCVRPADIYPKPPDFIRPGQKNTLISRLWKTLMEVAYSENLSEDAVRILGNKFNNLCQPTNADKLSMVFEELGIALSDVEKESISNRNRSLHEIGRAHV